MSIENDVRIIGNLGADPEFKETSGDPVCNIRVATTQRWKKDGEKQSRTEWHSVVFWGKSAELIRDHFAKGDGIIIQGELRTRSWEGDDGNKRYKTEIYASKFSGWMFPPGSKSSSGDRSSGSSSGNSNSDSGGSSGGGNDGGGYGGGIDDDIPF